MDESLRVFTTNERIFIGSVYVGLSSIILPFHLIILVLFLIHEDYRKQVAYRIMFSIGVADCLQQISHFYAGLITLSTDNYSLSLEKFMGGLGNATWIAMIPQTLVLAINRYNVFRKQNASNYLGIFQFLLLCCWIFGGAFFVTYMSSNTGILYDMYNFCWSYDSGPWSESVSLIEYYSSVPLLILAFIVYIGVVINITAMRASFSMNKSKIQMNEIKLLLQSFVIFLYAVILICCWHFYFLFLPDSPWTTVIINIFWILFGSINPILYLTMNKHIRLRFLQLLHLKKPDSSVRIITGSKTSAISNITHTRTFP